jgi:hypothetical protein
LQLQPQRLKSFQLAKLNKLLPMLWSDDDVRLLEQLVYCFVDPVHHIVTVTCKLQPS